MGNSFRRSCNHEWKSLPKTQTKMAFFLTISKFCSLEGEVPCTEYGGLPAEGQAARTDEMQLHEYSTSWQADPRIEYAERRPLSQDGQ